MRKVVLFVAACVMSTSFLGTAHALPEQSLEFCSQMVAEHHIANGINTTKELDKAGINGRPREIIEERIKEIEEERRAAEERRVAARNAAVAAARKPTPAPKPTPQTASAGAKSITVSATAYCSCSKCCGKSNGITASGAKASWGTLAADTKKFPFGTQFTIAGYGDKVFTVQDRGGAIKGNKIDIWFPTHAEALKFGRRNITVTRVN